MNNGNSVGTAVNHRSVAIGNLPEVAGMVGQYTQDTDEAVTSVHSALDRLYARLAVSLLPTPPDSATTRSATPAPMASPFAERLRAQSIGVQAAATRVEELLTRLDL